MTTLPHDVARCAGVGFQGDAGWDWREGCEDCLRRTAPTDERSGVYMDPPAIIAFKCPYRIAP